MKKEAIIRNLTAISKSDFFSEEMFLEYQKYYQESLLNNSKLCPKCIEWGKLDLPYDCLSKPKYCFKNDEDYMIIKLYEELKLKQI